MESTLKGQNMQQIDAVSDHQASVAEQAMLGTRQHRQHTSTANIDTCVNPADTHCINNLQGITQRNGFVQKHTKRERPKRVYPLTA